MPGGDTETDLPFVARDGLPVSGVLFEASVPPASGSLPAIVLVHGMAAPASSPAGGTALRRPTGRPWNAEIGDGPPLSWYVVWCAT
jgi:hypothetical protein